MTSHLASAKLASAKEDEQKETGRLEAFSDGVFSIAMTLLVLDLKIPSYESAQSGHALGAALLQQWPTYLAFITSFFTVLIMWVNHHRMFKMIVRVNTQLMFANGLLLMLTTVVPFSTGLVSLYFQKPGAQIATAVYCGIFVLISVGYNLTWWSASHRRVLLSANVSEEALQKLTKNYSMGIPMYLIATASAYVSVYLSIGICTALWVFWTVTAKD